MPRAVPSVVTPAPFRVAPPTPSTPSAETTTPAAPVVPNDDYMLDGTPLKVGDWLVADYTAPGKPRMIAYRRITALKKVKVKRPEGEVELPGVELDQPVIGNFSFPVRALATAQQRDLKLATDASGTTLGRIGRYVVETEAGEKFSMDVSGAVSNARSAITNELDNAIRPILQRSIDTMTKRINDEMSGKAHAYLRTVSDKQARYIERIQSDADRRRRELEAEYANRVTFPSKYSPNDWLKLRKLGFSPTQLGGRVAFFKEAELVIDKLIGYRNGDSAPKRAKKLSTLPGFTEADIVKVKVFIAASLSPDGSRIENMHLLDDKLETHKTIHTFDEYGRICTNTIQFPRGDTTPDGLEKACAEVLKGLQTANANSPTPYDALADFKTPQERKLREYIRQIRN